MKPRSQMTNEEIEEQARLLCDVLQGADCIDLEFEPYELFILISHIQLALRHPQAIGESTRIAEAITRRIIDAMPEAARPTLLSGFDPKNDVPL